MGSKRKRFFSFVVQSKIKPQDNIEIDFDAIMQNRIKYVQSCPQMEMIQSRDKLRELAAEHGRLSSLSIINNPSENSIKTKYIRIDTITIIYNKLFIHKKTNGPRRNAVLQTNSLNKLEKNVIFDLLENSPEIFKQMDNAIYEILKDGKIDMHDIPQIIFIIVDILKNHEIVKVVFEHDNYLNVIQFIINAILDSGVLPIPQLETDVAKKIIDSSLNLLITNLPELKKEEVGCFDFLFHCCKK